MMGGAGGHCSLTTPLRTPNIDYMKSLITGRLCAVAIVGLLALTTTACAPQKQFADASGCDPTWYKMGISVDVLRNLEVKANSTAGPSRLVEQVPIQVVVQGLSPAPGYKGVKYIGVGGSGTVGINPVITEDVAPYDAVACWPREMPVAFMLRAVIIGFNGLQAYDFIQCRFEDMDTFDFEEQEYATRQLDTGDLIPGSTPIAQCVKYYLPSNWSGDPLPTFPAPDES